MERKLAPCLKPEPIPPRNVETLTGNSGCQSRVNKERVEHLGIRFLDRIKVMRYKQHHQQGTGDAIGMKKPRSDNRVLLNRREALLLSATAGIATALPRPAHAADST